jgi:hypothetical protein
MLRVTNRYEINPHKCQRYALKHVAGFDKLMFVDNGWLMTHYRPCLDYDYGYVWCFDETKLALSKGDNSAKNGL